MTPRPALWVAFITIHSPKTLNAPGEGFTHTHSLLFSSGGIMPMDTMEWNVSWH